MPKHHDNQRRVVLAMSGGVDSSVAAHLLIRQGYDVIGVFMRHGTEPAAGDETHCSVDKNSGRLPVISQNDAAHKQGCCSASDAADARRVADDLDLPFYALNLREDFDRIIDYFVDEYSNGRTPNPCVMCNNWLKFGKLFQYADSVSASYVATGHYARIVGPDTEEEQPSLLRGIDEDKDQSYVLFGVGRQYLSRMLLPIGEYRKGQIRELATEFGLRVANKPDSQEICFVSAGKHADFVASRRGNEGDHRGQLVTTDGQVIGSHEGIERFTIGQRKGLGVAMGEPYFVVRIDAETKQVVIGKRDALARSELMARDVNWLAAERTGPFRCQAQIRYNSRARPATAHPASDGSVAVHFDEPCFGVAPGQAVVFYDGPRVLGGGWIAST